MRRRRGAWIAIAVAVAVAATVGWRGSRPSSPLADRADVPATGTLSREQAAPAQATPPHAGPARR